MAPFLPDILENMISFDWEIDYWGAAFDEKASKEESEKEQGRVMPIHDDPIKAWLDVFAGCIEGPCRRKCRMQPDRNRSGWTQRASGWLNRYNT